MDHADLMQAEAERAIAIGGMAAQARDGFGPPGSFAEALAVLARALPRHTKAEGDTLLLTDRHTVNGLLEGASQTPVTHEQVAWLAWLYWLGTPVRLRPVAGGYEVRETEHRSTPLPADWLADCIEQIGREAISP